LKVLKEQAKELKKCKCFKTLEPFFFNASTVLYPSSFPYPATYTTRRLTPVLGYASGPGKRMFTTINISGTISSDFRYAGGVLGPDGLIYRVPVNTDNIGVLSPVARTFTSIDISDTITSDWKYWGGVLGPNGLIYIVPFNANNIGIIDPATQTFTSIDISGTMSSDFKYVGGVMGLDGIIYLLFYNANNVDILDPVTQTFTTMDISDTISELAWIWTDFLSEQRRATDCQQEGGR